MPKIIRGKCPKTPDGKHLRYEDIKKIGGVYGTVVYCAACKQTIKKWKKL